MFNMEPMNEDEGAPEVMKVVEDFPMPTTEDLKTTEVWGNSYPQINIAGNCTHCPPAEVEEKDEWKTAMEEKEPTVERFRAISEHKGVSGTGQGPPEDPQHIAFTCKVAGDQQRYTKIGSEDTVSYCVNIVKSIRWPGALTVASGSRFASIYVGNGLKRGDVCFSPTEPPEVCADPFD